MEPHRRFNVLWGDNAQGKSNALEAVHLLLGLSAFRTHRSAELIRYSEDEASVRGVAVSQGVERELWVRVRAGQRQIRVDGKLARSPQHYLGGLSVVLFCPEDLHVPRGSPSARRRLLDRSVAAAWPAYLGLLRDYHKALGSRNRVLKGPGRVDPRLLEVYTAQVARLGAAIIAGRRRYLGGLAPLFSEAYRKVTRGGVEAELLYRGAPALESLEASVEVLTAALGSLLDDVKAEDLRRRTTTVGPHTDDLDFLLDGRCTRSFGSQGQLRAVILALRMAQISNSYRILGFQPVLLLDDVSSELDRERNTYLFEFIVEMNCQTFITTTDPRLIRLYEDRKDFHVVNGDLNTLSRG